jgi:hypothetical protein
LPVLRVATAVIFLAYVLHFFNYVEDDAFIPCRYAIQFLHGNGWVMNPGEHVEGYTSPLQLWYLTLLLRFLSPDGAIFAAKAVGFLLGLAVLAQTWAIVACIYPGVRRRWLSDVAVLLVALRPEFALSMTNVLETGFATWLLAGGVLRLLREDRDPTDPPAALYSRMVTALWFAGAGLARPELIPVFPLLTALQVYRKRSTTAATAPALTAWAIPVAALLLFRWSFYHDLLPNTYYAKQSGFFEAFFLGWAYLVQYALPLALPFGMVAGPFALVALRRTGRHRGIFFALAGYVALFVLTSGGTWSMDGRFINPILPLLAASWVAPLVMFQERSGKPMSRIVSMLRRRPVLAFVAAFVLMDALPRAAIIAGHGIYLHDLAFALQPAPPLTRWKCCAPGGRRRIGEWIAAHAKPGQLVAQSEMGVIPMMNPDIRFLDFRGLTDRTIAHMGACPHSFVGVNGASWSHGDGPLWAYLQQRRPDWIVSFDGGVDSDGLVNGVYAPSGSFSIDGDTNDTWYVETWKRVAKPPSP